MRVTGVDKGQRRVSCRVMMRDERRDIKALLAQLTPEQWQQDSLCAGWSVRDVVAHLVAWDELLLYRTRRQHLIALFRFGMFYISSLASMSLLNRRLRRRGRHFGSEELTRRFAADDSEQLKWLFDGTNPAAHLAEYVIHHQDIRRPLGLGREVPDDRLIAALEGLRQLPGVRLPAWRRSRRARYEATDVAWSAGSGPVVHMPAEAILMRLAGRPF